MQTFVIYQRIDKFRINNNHIVYSIMVPSLAMLAMSFIILKNSYPIITAISIFTLVLSFLVAMTLKFIGMFRHERLNGKLNGILSLEENTILFGSKIYLLDDIKKIQFNINDYYRKFLIRGRGDYRPNLSNGVDNYIQLELDSGKIIRCYFEIYNYSDVHNCRERLIRYHNMGKIHFLHLIDLLKITKYEDIQSFKNEINYLNTSSNKD